MSISIAHMTERSVTANTRRTARRLDAPNSRLWRTLHSEGVCPYLHSEYISDLAICLGFWNFASGSMVIAGCMVKSCLLTKRNSIATVSVTHTNLVCGQIGNLTRLCKVTCNYVTLLMCGVKIWMISWLDLSSSKIARLTGEVYPRLMQEELHQIWRTCPWINEVV
jgi:hypothetical protein